MNWLKKSFKIGLYAILFYATHMLIEAFIVTNIIAKFGWSIPIII